MARPMLHWLLGGVCTVITLGMLSTTPEAYAQSKDTLKSDTIPQNVMDALTARFPKAEIHKWTREKEEDFEVYDIEFAQEGHKYETDIKEDGTLHNWEMAIALKDLPRAARKAVEKLYPKASFKELMAITEVKDGKESLHGYEIVLETTDGKDVEVTVAPTGEILEDSGAPK